MFILNERGKNHTNKNCPINDMDSIDLGTKPDKYNNNETIFRSNLSHSEYLEQSQKMITVANILTTGLARSLESDDSDVDVDVFLSDVEKNKELATQKVMLKFTKHEQQKLFELTHRSKNLYNDALLLIRTLFYLPDYNKNVSSKTFGQMLQKLRNMLVPLSEITDMRKKVEIRTRLNRIKNKIESVHNNNKFPTNSQINSLQNELFYLLKYLDSYKSIGLAQVAQGTLMELNNAWKSYIERKNLWIKEKKKKKTMNRKKKKEPHIPNYLPKNGEYLVQYSRQNSVERKQFRTHLKNTVQIRLNVKNKNNRKIVTSISVSAEFRFPKNHDKYIKPIRINLLPQFNKRSIKLQKIYKKLGSIRFKNFAIKSFCSNFRTISILPKNGIYIAVITFIKKKSTPKLNLNYDRCVSIDLGLNILLAEANNFGENPSLYRGEDIKRANYRYMTEGAKYQRAVSITRYIKNKYYKKQKKIPILRIISDSIKKFQRDLKTHPHILKLKDIIESLNFRRIELYKKLDLLKASKQIERFRSKHRKFNSYIHDLHRFKYNLRYMKNQIKIKINYLQWLSTELKKSTKNHINKINQFNIRAENRNNELLTRRNNIVYDQTHKITRNLINYCIQHGVKNVIIGYKNGWKNSNLARKFNRHWRLLPIRKIIDKITEKANSEGILVHLIPEPNTSKCSALDREPIKKHTNHSGYRSPSLRKLNGKFYYPRGLYFSKIQKKYIHSDVNGAFNIMHRFDIKNSTHFFDRVRNRDMLLSPITVNLHTNNNLCPIASTV